MIGQLIEKMLLVEADEEENIRRYLSGEEKVLAKVEGDKYTVIILDNEGQLYLKNDIPEKPVPIGKWVDFWEEDHERYFGVAKDEYEKLPREKRAELEAKLQLKLWVDKQFPQLYYRWWRTKNV